jgi:hypothetical protein
MLLPRYRDLLVTAARKADPAVISAELPEQWYRVKVHGVHIKRYLTLGLQLARQEIESGTEHRLKRDPTWLRNPEEVRGSEKKGSSIVITVGSLEEARKLLINGIRFGGSRYRTEHYWELGPDTVCPRCCGIGHNSFKACGDRPPLCFICAGPHEGADHACKVIDCITKSGNACRHMPAKCGNCGGLHPATMWNCPRKREARKSLYRERGTGGSQRTQEPIAAIIPSPPDLTVMTSSQLTTRSQNNSAPISPKTPQPHHATQATQDPKTPTATWDIDVDMDKAQTPRDISNGPNCAESIC